MARREGLTVAAGGAALVAVLVLAGVVHDGVELIYGESGNGCRTLTPASNSELERALLPVRGLVFAWVMVTGIWLARGAVRADDRLPEAGTGVPLAFVLGVAQMLFIGTDVLSAALPMIALWIAGLVVLPFLVLRAVRRRGRPAATWDGLRATWVVVVAGVLPVVLLALTDDGAIRSC